MRITRSLSYVSLLCVLGCSGEPDGGGDVTSTAGNAGSFGQSGASGPPSGGAPGSAGAATSGAPSVAGQMSLAGSPGAAGFAGSSGSGSGGVGTAGSGPTAGTASGGASAGAPAGGSGAGGSDGGSGGAAGGSGGSTAGAPAGGSGGGENDPIAFYQSICAPCHGDKGQGVPMMGPEIQHPVRDFSTWVVRNGRMGHPSYPNSVMAPYSADVLPDATLNAIFDWLSTPSLPKPTTGEALYNDFCGTCHGVGGTGGPAGHNAKGEPKSKVTSMVRGGHDLMQFSKRTGYMPKWSASELTDAEIDLIYNYLNP